MNPKKVIVCFIVLFMLFLAILASSCKTNGIKLFPEQATENGGVILQKKF